MNAKSIMLCLLLYSVAGSLIAMDNNPPNAANQTKQVGAKLSPLGCCMNVLVGGMVCFFSSVTAVNHPFDKAVDCNQVAAVSTGFIFGASSVAKGCINLYRYFVGCDKLRRAERFTSGMQKLGALGLCCSLAHKGGSMALNNQTDGTDRCIGATTAIIAAALPTAYLYERYVPNSIKIKIEGKSSFDELD